MTWPEVFLLVAFTSSSLAIVSRMLYQLIGQSWEEKLISQRNKLIAQDIDMTQLPSDSEKNKMENVQTKDVQQIIGKSSI